jgi:hypothetical protein
MTALWCLTRMSRQASNELNTTARVLPNLIWKTGSLFSRHHFSHEEAWSSPSFSRCPNIGIAPGASGMPLIRLMSVPYAHSDRISLRRGSKSAWRTYRGE